MTAMAIIAAASLPAASATLATAQGFHGWVAKAVPGESCLYHSGFLGVDRMPKHSPLPEHQREELSRLADAVFAAADAGQVLLAQRRIDSGAAYLAIKAAAPTPLRRLWR